MFHEQRKATASRQGVAGHYLLDSPWIDIAWKVISRILDPCFARVERVLSIFKNGKVQ